MLPEYRPEKFSDLAQTSIGQKLWKFLNRPDSWIRMETSVELGKTPAEALAKSLVETFESEIQEFPRVRQMTGHMIRQIMERRGYQLSGQNRRTGNRRLFRSAAAYTEGAVITTRSDYINRYNQKNCEPISDEEHGQPLYAMECLGCHCSYTCSGSDLARIRCPNSCRRGG